MACDICVTLLPMASGTVTALSWSNDDPIAFPSLYHPSPEYHHHRDGKWAYHPISTRILIPSHPINTESKYHPIPSAPDSHYHPIPSTPDADYHPIPSMHFFVFPIPSHPINAFLHVSHPIALPSSKKVIPIPSL